MAEFGVQYLEDGSGVAEITPAEASARLRAACERLPISLVLLGWNLSLAVSQACSEQARQSGAHVYRWHPLLTGDATFAPRPEWRVIGLNGDPVPGFRGMPEFTFVCPNRRGAREAVLQHLHDALQSDDYHGVFLDRIRYPSPAMDPSSLLACFCEECRRAASDDGFDLEAARLRIRRLAAAPQRATSFVRALLDPLAGSPADPDLVALCQFMDFRRRSVTRLVQGAADLVHARGLAVGLDCFSPALMPLVGQDLAMLDPLCEWIKIMTYGHVLGPAGLPFEVLDLADWLVNQRSASESQALACLSQGVRLPLRPTRAALRKRGLLPEALAAETKRARAEGARTLLAGIELVEIEGVTGLDPAQIAADLQAFRAAGADGLVLSWDLWHIPLERLDTVRAIWL